MKYTLFFLLLFSSNWASAQLKLLKKLFPNDTTRHNSFLPVPVLGYSQEAGLQLGIAGIYSFYSEIKNPSNKASTVFGNAIYSTKGQNTIAIRSDIWTKGNAYHIIATGRLANNLFDYFGLGNDTKFINADKILQKQLRLNLEVEKEFIKHLYFGLGTEFNKQNFEDKVSGGIFGLNAPNDRLGGKVLFFSASQFYDTRNNSTYPDKGIFLRTKFSLAPDVFGSDNFSGNYLDIDFRTFKKLAKNLILGANVGYETINYAKNVEAFYLQPQMGNDEMMRGYYTGRFRAQNLIAAQLELRYRIIPRIGLVGFGGSGMVYNHQQFALQNLKPNYGLGARFFFDLEKSLSFRVDYGLGEKPAGEKRISGFYVSLGEAF